MWSLVALFRRKRCPETPLQRIERALKRLDRKSRAIFLAHRLDGLSYPEIAERTGLSVEEVERRMAKVIYRLVRAMPPD